MKLNAFIAAALLVSALPAQADNHVQSTQQVFEHHAQIYVVGHKLTLDDTMRDYAEDAIMVFTDFGTSGIRRGAPEIRAFYEKWHNFSDYPAATQLHYKIISGETVYIVWSSGDIWGTDTFIIRDGQIRVHTAYSGKGPAPK